MIKETYVRYDTALLLRKNGFDVDCDHYYVIGNPPPCSGLNNGDFKSGHCNNVGAFNASAPTQSIAMKWLRERFGITIACIPWIYALGHNYTNRDFVYIAQIFCGITPLSDNNIWRETFEQACEAAIQHCLNNVIGKDENGMD